MPTSLTISRFDIDYSEVRKPRIYSPHRYLARVSWDNRLYAFLKACTVGFMVGTAPLDSRPTRHRQKPPVELIRRRENRAEMSRELEHKTDSLKQTSFYKAQRDRIEQMHFEAILAKSKLTSFTVLAQSN